MANNDDVVLDIVVGGVRYLARNDLGFRDICELQERADQAKVEINVWLRTYDGKVCATWLMLRREHPELTEKKVAELLEEYVAEKRRGSRQAPRTTPRDRAQARKKKRRKEKRRRVK